jgi:hypothetical protein
MHMKSPTRARLAVSAAVTAGLCLAGTTALATPSQAATGTCDTAYPVAELTEGQPVTGLTVSSGTVPTGFTGSVIGVITDGVEPGVDLVMAKLTSPDIDAAGIWQGMSGSPVYAEDGSLIGAVSYTLSFGQTSIAGITPWEDMDRYAGTPPAPLHLRIPASAAKAIASRSSVTQSQASQGFHELKTPVVVAGISQRGLDLARKRPYLSKDVAAAGHAAADSSVDDMVAGGNLAATLSTGDILIAGLGTITSVCDDRVVGFGHPMNFVGKTTYGMAGASALYIQPDPIFGSFKVANIGTLLGTIDQDRMTGISGPLGPLPEQTPITSQVDYNDGTTTHTSNGETDVQLPDATAEAAYYELATNHQVAMDAYAPGGEQQTWTIHGHHAGVPFTFSKTNVYADSYSIADGASYDVPDLLWALTRLKGVTIDSVNVDSAVNDDSSRLHISGVQQKRAGSWVVVDRHHRAIFKAGKTATMRLVFDNGTGHPFQVHVPAKTEGMQGELDISGGYPYPFERGGLGTFAKIKDAVDNLVRNDQARVDFFAFGKRHVVRQRLTTPPAGKVMSGSVFFGVKIK